MRPDDPDLVLSAIPSQNEDALVAMVRIMRRLAAVEGYFSEEDLIKLYEREKERNEELRARLVAHHAVGVLNDGGGFVGESCPVCTEVVEP